MTSSDITSNPALLGFLGAIVGGLVVAFSGLLQSWLLRKHETQKQLRELAVKLAIEKWQYEAPLRDKMRHEVQATFAGLKPGLPLPTIPGVSLSETVLEMVKLLTSITDKTQEQK